MRFKIDENLPAEAVDVFRVAEHDAETALDEHLGGLSDAEVMEHCLAEQRAMVTLDMDFSDIRTYPPEQYPGLIVLRPRNQSRDAVLNLLGSL